MFALDLLGQSCPFAQTISMSALPITRPIGRAFFFLHSPLAVKAAASARSGDMPFLDSPSPPAVPSMGHYSAIRKQR